MQPFELNPTFCFTLLGTLFIYLWTRPPRWTLLPVLVLALMLRTICLRWLGGVGGYYGANAISWGAFLGIGALMILAVQVGRSVGPERVSCLRTFYAGAVFPMLALLDGYSVPLNLWLRPKTYDAFLLEFDGSLGFQPSFALGQFLLRSPTAWNLTTIVYYALPLAVCIAYASDRMRKHKAVAVLVLFLTFTTVGFAHYSVYPAVGPRYAFAGVYPGKPPSLSETRLQPMAVPDSPRNCMPSLHFGAALLVWWNSRRWPRWGRLLVALFVLATAFATLALGEHYLADLIVAFPFALIFQSACTTAAPWSERVRRNGVYAGIFLTVVWLFLLRFGVQWFAVSLVVPWGLLLLTVAWSTMLERNLAAAAMSPRTRARMGA
jgi:PAP2 superfamily